ncbi:MAG: ATP-grasp domain-containing protein [Actinomycetota bacterium]|nr:ATP-grasp domain-containing protein [Actinomycetota bacterium]
MSDVGAIVLGGDYQGLGIVRSLGRHGVPVLVVDDERSISRFSRYASRSVRVSDLADGDNTVDAVLGLERKLGLAGWVLFATRDETVEVLSRSRNVLSERVRVPVPPWETFARAWDKRSTYELAAECGIPVPRTWCPGSIEEVEEIDVEAPLVIKPAVKPRFFRATKAKAWRVDTRDQLRERFVTATQMAGGDPIMVQELIPGHGERQFAYCAFFKEGRSVGSMVVRRARQHPHDFGRASTFVETIEREELETMGERFLRAIDYYGLAELEFKFDARDHSYKLLDFNARTWGYHSLGQEAGVDFPFLLYSDQVGMSFAPCRADVGVTWIRLLTDLPTSLLDIRAGRLKASDYLRSVQNHDVEAVFSRDDPVPGLMEVALLPYLYFKRGF